MPDQQTNDYDILAGLRWLDLSLFGSTTGEDEAISAVCESAIEEIERLRARVAELEAGK